MVSHGHFDPTDPQGVPDASLTETEYRTGPAARSADVVWRPSRLTRFASLTGRLAGRSAPGDCCHHGQGPTGFGTHSLRGLFPPTPQAATNPAVPQPWANKFKELTLTARHSLVRRGRASCHPRYSVHYRG